MHRNCPPDKYSSSYLNESRYDMEIEVLKSDRKRLTKSLCEANDKNRLLEAKIESQEKEIEYLDRMFHVHSGQLREANADLERFEAKLNSQIARMDVALSVFPEHLL